MRCVLVACFVGSLVLSGCSTYTFTSHDYDYVAYHSAAIRACSEKGLMPPDAAATGNLIIRQRLTTSDYDRSELDRTIGKFEKRNFDTQACRNATVAVIGWQKEISQQREDRRETNEALRSATESIRAATPKQTYCNKMGTQVFCSTY